MLKKKEQKKNEKSSLFRLDKFIFSAEKDFLDQTNLASVVATYKPDDQLLDLVTSFLSFAPHMNLVVVDDSTPQDFCQTIDKLRGLSLVSPRLKVIRTPENRMRAGALNHGLNFLRQQKKMPEIIFCFDDDIRINRDTLRYMVNMLKLNPSLGAVCSSVRIENKNHNLLTRLQALEYHSFNLAKLADNGFVRGPLVMQGMLTAFRTKSLQEVGHFTENHLIEDYDFTARLKELGWRVGFVPLAEAWTVVPEKFSQLWKQRVRWNYGGLKVLADFRHYLPAIFQDLIGHLIFIISLVLISLSFVFSSAEKNSFIVLFLVFTATIQFLVSFLFNLVSLWYYRDSDGVDFIIRLTLIPETIYSTLLSGVMIGSYFFFLHNFFVEKISWLKEKDKKLITFRLFSFFGFNESWGTR